MHVSRWNIIVWLKVVLNRTVVDSSLCFDNLCDTIFRVKVSCITSLYGIKIWLLISLVN